MQLLRIVLVWALAWSAQAQTVDLAVVGKRLAFAREARALEELAQLVEKQRGELTERNPAWLELRSWQARGESLLGRWDRAESAADEIFSIAAELAAAQGVDSSTSLATALGASIEVLGQAYDAYGDRGRAVRFLRENREAYRGTSIETRIQKNLLLIDLVGKPMPALDTSQFVGRPHEIDLDGKVTVFYFWAHWCSDCKAQRPALFEVYEKYNDRGVQLVGPTRLFGYAAGGEDAEPHEEKAYIEGPWQEQFPLPDWLPKPLSTENFLNFGVSSTPTIVVTDRAGVVRLYHPGKVSLEELEAAVAALL